MPMAHGAAKVRMLMCNSDAKALPARQAAGFTLLELMMVLLLVGLLAGVSLTLDFSGNQSEQAAAEAFSGQWQLAALESLQRGETWGLDFFISENGAEQGYRWLRHDGQRWQLVDAALLNTRADTVVLAAGQQVQLQVDAASLGLENRQALALANGSANPRFQPEILLQPTREATPFSLSFCNKASTQCSERLQVDLLGRLEVIDAAR